MTLILPKLATHAAQSPEEEEKRLEELYSMDVLDASSDARFDRYTELATSIFQMPMASVVLVDKEKLQFKSVRGRVVSNTPRNMSFAAYAFAEETLLVVPDASEDPRFAQHPLVRGEPHIRFYAGGVIRGPTGRALGAICVMDRLPRSFSNDQQKSLLQLTGLLEHELQTRAAVADLRNKIREHVLFDAATRLPNQALFLTRLAKAIDPGTPKRVVVALMRMERFEAIHSAVGNAGTAYLVSDAASRLRQALGPSCLMGRIREDTIAVAFAAPPTKAAAAAIGKLIRCFRTPFVLGEHAVLVRASIGAAMFPDDGPDAETLVKRARTALHSMSTSDTSKYRLYNRRLSTEAARIFQIESALKGALDRDELELAYQPKIRLPGRQLAGAEALLRWTNEKLGSVSPMEFIPIAEDSGLILDLGVWVLDAACRQLTAWSKAGYECPEVSVNLSSFQLRQAGLYDTVTTTLKTASLEGARLNLEITEGSLIENIDEAIEIMHRLRQLGVTFSVDDFGKGFSSLNYLRQMPVQTLKIDRTFIEHLPHNDDDLRLVRSIIAMGRALNLTVIAEGVETAQQLETLQSAGCDQVQGFIIARPLPANDFLTGFLMSERTAAT